MSDIDKVLEAERTIHSMAGDLSRMKDAADLLMSSQDKADAILRASDAIIEKAGQFASESAEIIRRLAAMDLESRLSEVIRKAAETQKFLEGHLDHLGVTLNDLKKLNGQMLGASASLDQDMKQANYALAAKLEEQIGNGQKEARATLASFFEGVQKSFMQLQQFQKEQLLHLNQVQQRQVDEIKQSNQRLLIAAVVNALLIVTVLSVLILR